MTVPTANDFDTELRRIFQSASKTGAGYVDVESDNLHRAVGGYPTRNHRMPVCCHVMERNTKPGDTVLHAPPKGKGATLVIRYLLPR
jgi:hypothetical protein